MTMIINGTAGVTFPDTSVQSTASTGQVTEIITASTTWTVPAGVTKATVYCIGGGGGGGGSTVLNTSGGIGGLGGAGWVQVNDLSGSVSITIGAGGAGSNSAAGSAGGTSSFGSYISCTGGTAGALNANQASSLSGTATVGGTATRIRTAAADLYVVPECQFVSGSFNPNGAGSAAIAYSTSSKLGAGSPGIGESNQSTSDVSGGVGGAVVIIY